MVQNNKYDPISFQGVSSTYRAGNVSNTGILTEGDNSTNSSPVGAGFHDIAYVKELFRIMKVQIGVLVTNLENDLSGYSYIVDPEDEVTVLATEFVAKSLGLSASSGYVHFGLYKHLLMHGDSNAANYLISLYESRLRGPSGTISLDLLKLTVFISNEMSRMEEFIDEFIGEIDDTSEYRIIEAFQNWGENAYNTLSEILKASKKENRTQLPASELDNLDRSKATGTQALFKVKLNALNQRISSVFGEMYRDLNATADIFYRNYLGRALKFRLKISRDLGTGISSPILKEEIRNTVASLDSNFSVHLADLLKRISNFKESSIDIIGVATVRDSYNYYITQLASKGATVKNEFSSVPLSQEELTAVGNIDLVKDFRKIKNYEAAFVNAHAQLSGIDEDDAHPQYLLKAGGTITGDITLADGIKVGGIVPSLHKHNGVDGSAKIAGGDIEFNSITALNVNSSASVTGVPYNLEVAGATSIVGPTGDSTVTMLVSFDIEDDNVAGYEFEITELG
jgi:hypothetical protein